MSGHYSISKVESIDDLRAMFPPEVDYTLNWLFLGTSGIHGWYTSLDDLDDLSQMTELWENGQAHITVLVVHPRMVRMEYGDITIKGEDMDWLRGTVDKTMIGIMRSQQGSL